MPFYPIKGAKIRKSGGFWPLRELPIFRFIVWHRLFFIVGMMIAALPAAGSHIVGGEFELIHISGTSYRLNLIIYFDKLNGAPGAKDPNAAVSIFRKSDNLLVQSVLLLLDTEAFVDYTQPQCSHGEIVTNKLTYTALVELTPEKFGDAQGYYISWERCCRNYTITNIFSQNPQSGGISAGQTFYLEFPAVVKNGQPFINSSPHLFPPLNDYACPNKPYYVDFAGVDDDDDSLVYSLTTPLNTHTTEALPAPAPRPYPEITWRPGYSLTNIINGLPDLRISHDGLLTATPRTQGLFVFAVKVEEFRDGIKIGESRRDFQMLVVDGCAHAVPPQISGKQLADATFSNTGTLNVSFSNTVTDDSRCIQVRVADPDSENPADNFTENIKIRAVALNFKKKDLSEILPADVTGVLTNGSTKDFTICFPRCPYFEGGPYQIGIIAMDDACSLPLTDTLRVNVTVEPPANSDPYFTNVHPIMSTLNEGDQAAWNFQIKDDDLDSIFVYPSTDNFLLTSAGMTFSITTQQPGLVEGTLRWDAYCDIYDFTKRTGFQVKINARDIDVCDINDPVSDTYNLTVLLPGNSPPHIDTDLTTNPDERTVGLLTRQVNSSLTFNVFGSDADNDLIVLSPPGGVPSDLIPSISFAQAEANGSVQSQFSWKVSCDDFAKLQKENKDTLDLQFIVVDNKNKCKLYQADTVDVTVRVVPPDNQAPVLTVLNNNGGYPLNNDSLNVILGETISLSLQGIDPDLNPTPDVLSLELLSTTDDEEAIEGYSFEPAVGNPVQSTWTWTPECDVFKNSVFENHYTLTFRLADDKCFNQKADTVKVAITLKDIDGSDAAFLPPNVITPNGDGCNDYFAVEGRSPTLCNPAAEPDKLIALPKDNCANAFESVRIYNRWGKQVFESAERNFRWYALNEAAGVYYYYIQFTNKQYRGSLSVRY